MMALAAVSALVAAIWILRHYWRAPCPNCGHRAECCQSCAIEAGKRMGLR